MPLLRNIIATELENNIIQDRNFLISSQIAADQACDPCCKLEHHLDTDSDNQELEGCNKQIQCTTSTSAEILQEQEKAPAGDKECTNFRVSNEICEWEELNPALQSFIPPDDGFTYVITEFVSLSTESFPGSPKYAYKATVRINAVSADSAKSWMQKMMIHSRCTYRHTKGRQVGLKRVMYKALMHCQHKRKILSVKQQQISAEAKSKNSRKILIHDNRQKKTECPSKMTLTVNILTKMDKMRSKNKPFLLTHPTVVQITFNHNHPIDSAHVLSFRPVAPETKEIFYELFRKGHTASSFHWHETKLYLDGGEDQILLADRAFNPTKPDISRLYGEWQKKELGHDNGKLMFDKLQTEIAAYNDACGELGGKAEFQCFEAAVEVSDSCDSDTSDFDSPPRKKKRKRHHHNREKPMIIAICTPLMGRVHKHIQQAGEMVFCDSTSTLDRFNTSLFILSTSHPSGGMPLAVMITSDEKEETILQGLNMLKKVLPKEAFCGRGVKQGPTVTMTDDSLAERNALHSVWPGTQLLLCVFHFLQAKWTWLHDGQNRIANEDRSFLIAKTKMLVYADTEDQLFRFYNQFQQCDIVKKYPRYLGYIKSQWDRRQEWAICYRKKLLLRGNQTNNYAEAGIRILKDLVFSRVKAYNLVQMFSFVTECLELYYIRKILSVAHNRFDRHISLKFQGLKCAGISLAQVQKLDEVKMKEEDRERKTERERREERERAQIRERVRMEFREKRREEDRERERRRGGIYY